MFTSRSTATQNTASHYITLSRVDICTSRTTTTQHTVLQHTIFHCNTLEHAAVRCNTLQHTATHCNKLHHAARHCNTQSLTGLSTSRTAAPTGGPLLFFSILSFKCVYVVWFVTHAAAHSSIRTVLTYDELPWQKGKRFRIMSDIVNFGHVERLAKRCAKIKLFFWSFQNEFICGYWTLASLLPFHARDAPESSGFFAESLACGCIIFWKNNLFPVFFRGPYPSFYFSPMPSSPAAVKYFSRSYDNCKDTCVCRKSCVDRE